MTKRAKEEVQLSTVEVDVRHLWGILTYGGFELGKELVSSSDMMEAVLSLHNCIAVLAVAVVAVVFVNAENSRFR
jgi:hypothetical protein